MEKKDQIIYSEEAVCFDNTPKPLTKEKLYEIVGKPVFVVGHGVGIEAGWKVIRRIIITRGMVEIAFTDDDCHNYNIGLIKIFEEELPEEMANKIIADEDEIVDTIKQIIRQKRYL